MSGSFSHSGAYSPLFRLVAHPQPPPGNGGLSILSPTILSPTTTLLTPVTDVALLTQSSPKSTGSSSPTAPRRSPVLSTAPPFTQESGPLAPPLTDEPAPIGDYRRVSDPSGSSSAAGRLSPLQEDPSNPNIPDTHLSASSQPTTVPRRRMQSRPSASSGPSPTIPRPENLQRQFSNSSSSSRSTSGNSDPSSRRWWVRNSHKRSQTTPNTTPDMTPDTTPDTTPNASSSVNDDPSLVGPPSSNTPFLHRTVPRAMRSTPDRSQTTPMNVLNVVSPPPLPPPSRSASIFTLPSPSRKWEPVNPTVSRLMEDVARDSECIVRLAVDGAVSSGNLEGLVSRVINGSADLSRDEYFKATFLTIYGLFTSCERLFDILKRRFESTDPSPAHTRSRYL